MRSMRWHNRETMWSTRQECTSHISKYILIFSNAVFFCFVIKNHSGLIANVHWWYDLGMQWVRALPPLQLSSGKSAPPGNQTFNCCQMLKLLVWAAMCDSLRSKVGLIRCCWLKMPAPSVRGQIELRSSSRKIAKDYLELFVPMSNKQMSRIYFNRTVQCLTSCQSH